MQKKRSLISLLIIVVLVPIATILSMVFLPPSQRTLASLVICVLSFIPLFVSFEKHKYLAREVAAISSVIALAVASRAAFYMLPQVKPVAAIVIAAAIVFGYEVGFFAGAMTMLISDLIFSVGVWTPFQMIGLGMVGFAAGLIFSKKERINRFVLAISGFVLTFIVYGFFADMSSVIMMATDNSFKTILSIYGFGVPMNLVFAASTAVILLLFGNLFIEKTSRIKNKYGLFEKEKV